MPPKFTTTKKASTETSASLYDQYEKMLGIERDVLWEKKWMEREVSEYKKDKEEYDEKFDESFKNYLNNPQVKRWKEYSQDWHGNPTDSAKTAGRLYDLFTLLDKPLIEFDKTPRKDLKKMNQAYWDSGNEYLVKKEIIPPDPNRDPTDEFWLVSGEDSPGYELAKFRHGKLKTGPEDASSRLDKIVIKENTPFSGLLNVISHELGHQYQGRMLNTPKEVRDFHRKSEWDRNYTKDEDRGPYGNPNTIEYQADRIGWDFEKYVKGLESPAVDKIKRLAYENPLLYGFSYESLDNYKDLYGKNPYSEFIFGKTK